MCVLRLRGLPEIVARKHNERSFTSARKGRDNAREKGNGGGEEWNPWKSAAGRKHAGIICIFTRARRDDVFRGVIPPL